MSQVGAFTICNSFDSNVTYINIDSTSIWKIGEPTKSIFDSSYSGINSIVTDLDSLYPNSDTSRFYALYTDQGHIPGYLQLYYPLEIEFDHRFITDSITDYGSIEISVDKGNNWYNILSDSLNPTGPYADYDNYHYFEGVGDTIFDSISIFGNSNGWVHSKFSKEIQQIIWDDNPFPDTIIVRFSFITDSIGSGNEGWQIDNLCINMDFIVGVQEFDNPKHLKVFPNPCNGNFTVEITPNNNQQEFVFELYDILGKRVLVKNLHPFENTINVGNLASGVYTYKIGAVWGKVVVE